ncbi:E7 protein [Bos taurus papillomavirus 19]|uniref:Protein E7 n=1 Tax=Bos taurus papillomavirus 19 TaxID=1887217 RepID=A0A1B2K222_9PAPI|nr:E7 protein [Bos taurus papillomavirus 19]ANZ90251.1 E7 protein [Bos taurus papillomavirus 19]
MRGEAATIKDIDLLHLSDLIQPHNLECQEELPAGEELKEELCPYGLDTCCASCSTCLRLYIVTSNSSIRLLQELFLKDLSLLCARCSRTNLRNGR